MRLLLKTWIPATKDFRDQGLDPTDWVNDNVEMATDGKLGKCLYFNGSSARLSSHTYSLGEKWSWSVWIKDDPDVTGWRIVFILNSNGSDADTQTALWVKADETRLEVCNDAKWVSTIKYIPGQWNHIAQTYDGTTTNVYLNGSRISGFTSPDHLVRTNMTIGGRSTNVDGGHVSANSYYKGYLNDFRIWNNEVLSPQQIKRLSQGLCLHYRLSGIGGENLLSNTKSNWGKYSCSSGNYSSSSSRFAPYQITIPISSSTKYICHITDYLNLGQQFYVGIHQLSSDLTFLNDSGWRATPYSFTSLSNAAYVRLTFRDALNNATNIQSYLDNIGDKILIKFEKGDKLTPWCPNSTDELYSTMGFDDGIEYDCSGFGNNGVKTNILWDSNTARYTGSYLFNGNNSQVKGHMDTLANFFHNDFTIAFWIYDDDKSNRSIYIGNYQVDGAGNGIGIEKTTGAGLRLWWYGNPDYYPSGFTIPDKEWTHIAIAKSSSEVKFYKNGSLINTYTYSLPNSMLAAGTSICFGVDNRTGEGGVAFKGNMSDVRFYASVLSADDILALYNLGGSLDSNGTFHTYEYVEV